MARKKAVDIDETKETPPDEETLKEFDLVWKDFVCDSRGRLKRNEVIKTLVAYGRMETEVSKVYMEITGGKMSKPGYEAGTVIAVANDYDNEVWDETLADEKKAWEASRAAELQSLNDEIARLRAQVQQQQEALSVTIVKDACCVTLRPGPRDARPVVVTIADGPYNVLWDQERDVIVVDEKKPLPEDWLDTVLDAVKKLDTEEN